MFGAKEWGGKEGVVLFPSSFLREGAAEEREGEREAGGGWKEGRREDGRAGGGTHKVVPEQTDQRTRGGKGKEGDERRPSAPAELRAQPRSLSAPLRMSHGPMAHFRRSLRLREHALIFPPLPSAEGFHLKKRQSGRRKGGGGEKKKKTRFHAFHHR